MSAPVTWGMCFRTGRRPAACVTASMPCRWSSASLNRPRAADIDELQELRAGARVAAENADHAAGHHRHATLVNAARGHALVLRVNDHAHAARLEHLINAGGDLCGEFFLYLETPGVAIHHARQL